MQPNWHPAELHPEQPDSVLLDWLTDEGSLTLRLTAAGNDDFRVEVLSQCSQPARADEAEALGLNAGEPVWVREVLLHTAGAPRVFARSVAPLSSLAHDGIDLQNVGTRSLGLQLFSHPRVSRGKLEISRYPVAWLPVAWRTPDCWARRSLFSDGPLQLLVCEVFLAGWPTR
ncbi:MAG: chorismate--pyruvate lyase [Gammaproteobacteria bacterium HGW-Gammaproteobacteria-11]|nr:MAG: chorismate--pyruvate lyase [Gammaproteobacteria bacterium HGW-Gammaproteobacteria-11]